MLRPGRDYPQFRPGGMTPVAPPPMNVPLNVPMNTPMNMAHPFVPPPMGGGSGYLMPHVSGGHFAYPPPPPTPVPSPHLAPYLPSLPAPSFVPPLPHSPPVEPPPPPPPVASPSAAPPLPLSSTEQIAIVKLAPLQLPAQPPKPTDPEILKNIEGMAEFVVRNGPRYESIARAKHAGDPKFTFLFENDSGLEASINRDFYKWRKEVFQLQAEAVAESKSQKRLDFHSDATQSQLASQTVGQPEEIPQSPTMSDMDMEDDLAAPSPKRDSSVSPGRASHFNRVDRSQQKQVARGLPKEVSQPLGKGDSPSKGKRAQCRLTGDYTGALIDNYLSDASEDSENSEPSASLGMTGSGSSDHRKEGKVSDQSANANQVSPRTEDAENTVQSEANFFKEGQSAGVLQHVGDRLPDAANSCGMTDVSGFKALEPQERTGEVRSEVGLPVQECESHQVEILEKRASPSTLEEIRPQPSRRRSRSYSRSRSRSRSRSLSRSHSRSRSRSRSASQSMEDESKSPSPTRSGLHNKSSRGRTSPKDIPNGVEKGEYKLQARENRGAKGGGSNICLNFARGRCFRGNSCRFQHQGSDKGLDEVDRVQELEEHGTLKITASPQNLEGKIAGEVVNTAGPSAEAAASKKAKRKVGAEKKEATSEEEAAKRSKSIVETAVTPPQEGISAVLDPSVRATAGGLSPAQQDESALPSSPAAGSLFSEAPHLSDVTCPSPFPPSNPSRHSIGNSSQAAQPYGSLGQRYPVESGAFGFQQHYPSQFSGSAGFIPSNAYTNTVNERDRAFGMTFPGGNHAQVHPPSSGIGENSHFQLYPHGSSVSGAPTGSTLHDYSDLARSYTPSHPSEYGLSFQSQSGIAQSARGPPSTLPPPLTSMPSSTAVRQQHEHQGFTSSQHGFSSPFSLSAQQHQSLYPPPFPGDALRQSRFSDVANHALPGVYPQSTLSSQSQNSTPWSMPGSLGNLSSKGLEMSSITGNTSSYSYALTTIPPLPSIIELPGTTVVSTSSDQYDPLSDSFEPSLSGGPKPTSFSFSEEGKSFGNTLTSRLENLSPGLDLVKGDLANMNEIAGDPVVGIVENVSPPGDNRDWSPGQPPEAAEAKQGQSSSKTKKNNSRGLKLLRSAVAEHVKEVLKPTWKEGHMSKDAFKNIVKKAVDKVTATLPTHHIPKSQEKVDQFMSSSRMKIAKLVQGYIDKYQKT